MPPEVSNKKLRGTASGQLGRDFTEWKPVPRRCRTARAPAFSAIILAVKAADDGCQPCFKLGFHGIRDVSFALSFSESLQFKASAKLELGIYYFRKPVSRFSKNNWIPYGNMPSGKTLRIVIQKEKIKGKDFFFPKACLTSILQNSFMI
jgi:hypothetical protein